VRHRAPGRLEGLPVRHRLVTAILVCASALALPPPAAAFSGDAAAPVTASSPGTTGALAEAVRERVDQLRYAPHSRLVEGGIRGARIDLPEGVAGFYEASRFEPQWQDPRRLDELIAAVADLRYDGLDPDDYHVVALQSFRSELRGGRPLSTAERADLDVLATDAMMLAMYHLYAGKVDPARLSSQWNYPVRPLNLGEAGATCCQAVAADRIREMFERARPQHPWYRRGRERLKQYYAIRDAGGWPQIAGGPSLHPGDSDSRVPALRVRLAITGDLDTVAAGPTRSADTGYDAALEAAVRHFQQRHGLTPDGVVGRATLAAMNVPVSARIDQIRVNMERARWVLHELKGEFVLVDVAGFDVSWFRGDESVWTSRVIVGRPYRETPIFKSLITYVVFNPTWTIPPGILVKDKLPILRKDPGYLSRNHIRVIDADGRELDPRSIDWNAYGARHLPPFQLRQDPGDDNALGRVKIMFPNPYSVYLHDTPTKSLFDKDQRTFSSGCIRVQKAFELAQLVLGDPSRWNAATMAEVVAAGATRTVNLARPVPILILYWTAQPTPDGQVIFRNDVYGRDPPTLAALDAPVEPIP
jgi:murein L,D-transpeptidase YcbB/YkuD